MDPARQRTASPVPQPAPAPTGEGAAAPATSPAWLVVEDQARSPPAKPDRQPLTWPLEFGAHSGERAKRLKASKKRSGTDESSTEARA